MNLNASAASPRQVSSRDQLCVKDIITGQNAGNGVHSHDSTKPSSGNKGQSHLAQLHSKDKNKKRIGTAGTTTSLNAKSLEDLAKLQEMHSRFSKAKVAKEKTNVKSDNTTSPKKAVMNSIVPERGSAKKHDSLSEKGHPWENRALDSR